MLLLLFRMLLLFAAASFCCDDGDDDMLMRYRYFWCYMMMMMMMFLLAVVVSALLGRLLGLLGVTMLRSLLWYGGSPKDTTYAYFAFVLLVGSGIRSLFDTLVSSDVTSSTATTSRFCTCSTNANEGLLMSEILLCKQTFTLLQQ